jgi:hypothetical protein
VNFLKALLRKLQPRSGGRERHDSPTPRFDEAIHRRLRDGLGTELPPDYLRFLRTYDGEVPEPNFFWVVPNDWGSGIDGLFGMHGGDEGDSLLQALDWDGLPLKPGLIPIGSDGSFGYLLLSLRPEDRGSVHFCTTWSDDGKTDVFGSQGFWKIANSFDEFLTRLQASPDEE